MNIKTELEQKLEDLDRKVKAKLAVHKMDPKLRKMYRIRESFKKIGRDVDDHMELIERMKTKLKNLDQVR